MFRRFSKLTLLSIFVALAPTVPVHAGKNYKISNYGGGHQIWFEAEDYDERNPNTEAYFRVVDQADAFGKAVTRVNAAGGMMRWTFDISAAGGKAGTWYFWVREINPSNLSDYMLVEGDPGDPTLPTGPPFPGGDGAAPFTNADDQILEATLGPPWAWGLTDHASGHTKQLRNGNNTMYIYHRQGSNTVFWDVFMWTDSATYRPTDDDYRNAKVLLPGTALDSLPGDGATDVARDATLSWTAGKFAGTHDVYFGTVLTDVDTATRTDAKGVLASQGQTQTTFAPPGGLDYGKTYYWRIDEVNQTPDNTIFKGAVWSFTVEPYGYPVTPVRATAASNQTNMGPEKTIDGSGMTGNLHGTDGTTMWMSAGVQPNWIQYEFDNVYPLHDLQVWNSNQLVESFVGFGARKVTVETSTDGTTWTPVANVPEFAQGSGTPGYAANTTINLGGVAAKYVKLTINTNWGGVAPQSGLAEIRFSYVPTQARMPQPGNDSGGIALDADLAWRPGRDVTSHKVFFGTDQAAVAAGTAPAKTVTEHSFDPGALNFGTFYYWKVDEVGTATYPGSVWSFNTRPYQTVDDFESYTDKQGEEVFTAWVDGMTNSNGSIVGLYPDSVNGTFCETTIIHGGRQSMPFEYNNIKTPFYSEATRTFDTAQDWTGNGATTLSLSVRGAPVDFVDKGGGAFTVGASGHDIWDAADDFRFVYKKLSGDGSIIVRVDSLVNTNAWAKAGVMIRQNLTDGSPMADMVIASTNGANFQWRATAGANADSTNSPSVAGIVTPQWVKLTRKGSVFSGQYSADGKTWLDVKNPTLTGTLVTMTVNMTGDVYIGMCLTSHDSALTTTAEFSGVATTGNVSGAWQQAWIGNDPDRTNDAASLYVVVEDKAGKKKTVVNSDAGAVGKSVWTEWKIPLSDLTGVNVAAVKKLTIGVGDPPSPKAGGAGKLYIDDICFGKPIQWVALPGQIFLEAEAVSAITAPMAISTDPLASGGMYIGTPTSQADSGNNPPTTGVAKIPFTVPGGKYKLLFRVLIPGDNNSVWIRIADGTTQTKNHASGWVRFNEIPGGETWHWAEVYSSDDGDQVVEWTLAPGAHTLEIAYREAGARVDAIVIQPLN